MPHPSGLTNPPGLSRQPGLAGLLDWPSPSNALYVPGAPGAFVLQTHPSLFVQLTYHAGSDNTRREGDNRYARERGDHVHDASRRSCGGDVAVTNCCQADDRPIECVEEGLIGFRFDVEHDRSACKYVDDGEGERDKKWHALTRAASMRI